MIKQLPVILVLLTIGLFSSCDQAVRFEQPQPRDQPDLKRLPDRLSGVYYSPDDSSTLEISEHRVVLYHRALIHVSIADIGEGIMISGDTVIDVESGFREVGKRFADSISVHWPLWTDTLFMQGDQFILRKFKSRYFLNHETVPGQWEVFLIDHRPGGDILLEELLAPEDISLLDEITPVTKIGTDSILGPRYEINPDRKALKKLMRRGFTARGKYQKLKQDGR